MSRVEELGRMDERRRSVMLEAACEIEALAHALPDQVPNIDGTQDARRVVRGMAARLSQLAGALMSGLDEEEIPTDRPERDVVFGGGA